MESFIVEFVITDDSETSSMPRSEQDTNSALVPAETASEPRAARDVEDDSDLLDDDALSRLMEDYESGAQ